MRVKNGIKNNEVKEITLEHDKKWENDTFSVGEYLLVSKHRVKKQEAS